MYRDIVTIFNRKHEKGRDTWFPTVLRGVDLNVDRAAIAAKYGAESQDKALLHVKFAPLADSPVIGGKVYFAPKEWAKLEDADRSGTITFTAGERFDFFLAGEWPDENPIPDDAYTDGLYDHLNRERDGVFAITGAARYNMLPHFEITGR